MDTIDQAQSRRDKIHGYLIIFESWLEIATKQEIQARQSRSNLVFASLASGVALSSLFLESKYSPYVLFPLILTVACCVTFNYYYQRKAASWKKASEEVVLKQKLLVLAENVDEMEVDLRSFNLHQVYKYYKSGGLVKLYFDLPSIMLYLTLVVFAIIVILVSLGIGVSLDGAEGNGQG